MLVVSPTLVNLLLAILIGALAGLHISTWGMYKDAPHEGFSWFKYFRSTVVGAVLGGVAHHYVRWDLGNASSRFVYWGLIYCLERAVCEFWKYFIREEDQAKYFIPMQFGIMGRPIKNAPVRITIGVIIAVLCVLVFLGIQALERRWSGTIPMWLVVLTIGSIFGWISAFGGAWKDAPIEGFETLKFFRSPSIAISWAFVVSQFTSSWPIIALAGEGFTVASIETYKKFMFPNLPPGKFAGKPITHPGHFEFRRTFVPVFFGIWALVLGHLVFALLA
jgi:hypothetical protein